MIEKEYLDMVILVTQVLLVLLSSVMRRALLKSQFKDKVDQCFPIYLYILEICITVEGFYMTFTLPDTLPYLIKWWKTDQVLSYYILHK